MTFAADVFKIIREMAKSIGANGAFPIFFSIGLSHIDTLATTTTTIKFRAEAVVLSKRTNTHFETTGC